MAEQRTAIRLSIDARGREVTPYRVLVTPRDQLPRVSDIDGSAPLDVLCKFCDQHGWHTRRFDPIVHPPVPMAGEIFPSDRLDEPAAVTVAPLTVVRQALKEKEGTAKPSFKFSGTYRVTVHPSR